jgi:hypothetical protein
MNSKKGENSVNYFSEMPKKRSEFDMCEKRNNIVKLCIKREICFLGEFL